MTASHRRAATRVLTAVAFGTLVLTGCGEGGTGGTDPVGVATTDTSPADSGEAAAPSDAGKGSQQEQASTGRASWAGTKQFVTIDKAWTEDSVTRLSVRSAQKEINTRFDTWIIVPGTGPFTTVTMAEDVRILLTAPVRGDDASGVGRGVPLPHSPAEFVTLLKQLDPRLSAGVGYDLSFDGEGRVAKVQSQFRP